ncbi:transcriptional regulator [Clostridium pasteurianum DSM 525 = ATCC 6013]|uniref:Transcriptional regulator n=1 Tax=Clostridium pasteurianum DSM 525 = ATCC 6013 TaxID=1262449 RepID=A0A0H3J2Z6_CLOPA|nr:helix-turn-helix transcriptional regulator [Clostridium pasteurianum]AJA46288.1 transcriptional regulator [Clostridium pasteurianum DSM 525 = ATCC 6013]AJA50276.1 transcriptional regulator [Clostridium pasteurianum DSM 525 = ATCC 6013]ELP60872.1 transcriptional regulator [Clostridium pasteurianum DSM 525 = ATCC 6013]KRU13711.1 transcriptional regulator, XRE family [Clostridium pasteurianum DSM 525 = ATCC 6013]
MKLSDKLRELRKINKMSQQQLARKLNVTNQAVFKWELGKSYPDILNLVKLSDIYNISLDDLIKEDVDLQKNLSNKNKINYFYIFLCGIVLECLSSIISYYLKENVFTNWIVRITALIGFICIIVLPLKMLPKKIKYLLGIERYSDKPH